MTRPTYVLSLSTHFLTHGTLQVYKPPASPRTKASCLSAWSQALLSSFADVPPTSLPQVLLNLCSLPEALTPNHTQAQFIWALPLPLKQYSVINFYPLLLTIGCVMFIFVSKKQCCHVLDVQHRCVESMIEKNEYTKILPIVIFVLQLSAMLLYYYPVGRCNIW